jgi:hypothetical protein
MGRVINPDTGGKQRTYLTRCILHACQMPLANDLPIDEIRDRAAFIYFSLIAIDRSINITVTAWERRDFWVKADKFRLEWSWAEKFATRLKEDIESAYWTHINKLFQEIQSQLVGITLAPHNRLGSPWFGAWDQYIKTKNSRRD